jgi:hypothetical protein
VRNKLIAEDGAFLAAQLESESIRLLLVNGASVWRQLQSAFTGKLNIEHHETIWGLSHQTAHLDSGRLLGKVCVIAWNTNLQSSFGVTSLLKEELARRASSRFAQSRV